MDISDPASFYSDLPGLTPASIRITSPEDGNYNCIAWAAGDNQNWWWPWGGRYAYWPRRAPREVTLSAFIDAFQGLGYEVVTDFDLEVGYEKVAIYALQGTPTHAARQLPGGEWASKCGASGDIVHDLVELEGPGYGQVAVVLRRSFRPRPVVP